MALWGEFDKAHVDLSFSPSSNLVQTKGAVAALNLCYPFASSSAGLFSERFPSRHRQVSLFHLGLLCRPVLRSFNLTLTHSFVTLARVALNPLSRSLPVQAS